MSTYQRTAIRRLAVRGYRSLKDVVVEDIPDIVVLHGPNGSGKSNLLRAAQLLLRAAGQPSLLPTGNVNAVSLSLQDADRELTLRPDDFHFGSIPQIRVALTIELGHRTLRGILPDDLGSKLACLDLAGVFQYDGDKSIRFSSLALYVSRSTVHVHLGDILSVIWPEELDHDAASSLLKHSCRERANPLTARNNTTRIHCQSTILARRASCTP